MKQNVIRLFISSTFADFQAERDSLHQNVFPKLETFCQSRGLRFEAVDLRWGVSEKASENKETLQICLSELQRCRELSLGPYMLVLLGDRYGSQLVPEKIDRAIFQKIISSLSHELANNVKRCYRLDKNPFQPVYRLQPEPEWPVSSKELLSCLEEGINATEDEPPVQLLASATELEILSGLTDNSSPTNGVHCFFREIKKSKRNSLGFPWVNMNEEGNIDEKALQKLKVLKRKLKKAGNTTTFRTDLIDEKVGEAYLKRFCEGVFAQLSAAIASSIQQNSLLTSLQMEKTQQQLFMRTRGNGFVGRKVIMKKVGQYFTSPSTSPLIIHGSSGDGKSSILAKIGTDSIRQKKRLIYRFIGASPESSDGRSLLQSLLRELSELLRVNPPSPEASTFQLAQNFRQLLLMVKTPLIILIDALDQLTYDDESSYLTWIPPVIPKDVKMIISTTPGKKLELLQKKGIPAQKFLALQALSLSDARNIIKNLCHLYETHLTRAQKAMIEIGFRECRSPLFLYIAFQRARQWTSYEKPNPLGNSPQNAIKILLQELSEEENHGKLIVSKTQQWIALSRFGLSHSEICKLLARDESAMKEVVRRHPHSPTIGPDFPPILWFRLYYDLLPYIKTLQVGGNEVFSFFHNVWLDVVGTSIGPSTKKTVHAQLANCFALHHSTPKSTDSPVNLRFLLECPYHQIKAKLIASLDETILDADFMEAKINQLGVQKLIEDYTLATIDFPRFRKKGSAVWQINKFLNRYANILTRKPQEFTVHLLSELSTAKSATLQNIIKTLKKKNKHLPLQPGPQTEDSVFIVRVFDFDQSVSPSFTEDQSGDVSSRIWGIDSFHDGNRIIAAHHDGMLRILDRLTGTTVGILVGHTSAVNAVTISPDQKTILSVSGDGTLIKWSATSYEKLWEVQTKEGLLSVAIHPKLPIAATGGNKGTTWVWNIASEKRIKIRKGHKDVIWQMCFDPTGDFLYTVSQDGSIIKRSTSNWKINIKVNHPIGVLQRAVDINTDSQILVIADGDGIIAVCNAADLEIRNWWQAHDQVIRDLAITPDAKNIISVSQDGFVKIWNLKNGRLVQSLSVHADAVHAVKVSQNGQYFYTGDDSGKIIVWDLKEILRRKTEDSLHQSSIIKLLPIHNGERLLSGSVDGQLAIWETKNKKVSYSIKLHLGRDDYLKDFQITSDLRYIFITSYEKVFSLDLQTNQIRQKEANNTEFFATFLSYEVDTNFFISVTENSRLSWWSVPDLELVRTTYLRHLPVDRFEMSIDQTKILISDWTKNSYPNPSEPYAIIHLSGKRRRRMQLSKKLRESTVNKLLDNKNGVAYLRNEALCIWDLESRKIIRHFGDKKKIIYYTISKDKKHILTVDREGILYRWNYLLDKQQKLATINAKDIQELQIVPRSTLILFITSTTTLNLFDFKKNQLLSTFSVHSQIYCYELIDKNLIVLGETSGRIHFLSLVN